MIRFFLGLLLRSVVVLTGLLLGTFALLWQAPGDPAEAIAMARHGTILPADVVDVVRIQAGLDLGFWHAFRAWVAPLLLFDFGRSAVTGREVLPDLWTAISYTFPLALAGLALGVALALPLAILAARRPGSLLDRAAITIASLGVAIPAYWSGLLLILLFAVHLDWLSAVGARTPGHIILPALTLSLGVTASLTRIIRSSILEARGQRFLPALRRRGISAFALNYAHVVPHAAIPVVTVFGLELAFLLEGAIIVEVIFNRPGLGTFLLAAIHSRDFPQVQAVVIFTAFLFVIVNLVIDIFYRFVDPRIGGQDA